jgi:aryl-alcohol dehydrogenase-like predicted oxidoreductase
LGVSTSALALAWVLDQGPHLLPIPGTRHIKHVAHYLDASSFVMTYEIRAQIDAILPIGWAMGDRYNDDQWVGVERYS